MADKTPLGFQQKIKEIVAKMDVAAVKAANVINTFELPFQDMTRKTAGKIAITAAALMSVVVLIAAGADLSPAAIAQGAKDKRALAGASGEGYPFDIDGSRAISAAGISNGTALLTDTNYIVLNGDGREVISEAHYMASPIMQTADRYTLLFDRRGNSYALKTLSGSICSGKTGNAIITGAVSRSGRFALVTQYDTANSYVFVYSKSGSVLHKWKSSTYHISDITVNPSGSLIAMCGVTTTDEGQLKSCVIIQKVGGSQNLREYVFDGTLLFSVRFTDSDSVTAVGDDMAARVSAGAEKKLTYSYDGRTLTGFDISDNGNLALALSAHSDGQNTTVTVLNSSCHEVVSLETALDSPYVELTNSRINLIGASEFYSYNFGGKSVKNASIPADSESVLTSQGKVLVKGISTITKVD